MKKAPLFAAVAALALSALPGVALAAAPKFTCPWLTGSETPSPEITALFQGGDPLDNPALLNSAVDKLRASGLSRALIIDGVMGAYCPMVAANASYSDAQKTARMSAFAGRTVRVVYALESADAVILDVPLPPPVVDSLNAKARAAGVSPTDWLVGLISSAVAAK